MFLGISGNRGLSKLHCNSRPHILPSIAGAVRATGHARKGTCNAHACGVTAKGHRRGRADVSGHTRATSGVTPGCLGRSARKPVTQRSLRTPNRRAFFVVRNKRVRSIYARYVPFTHGGQAVVACLHQARAIDYRRLSNKLGQIDTDDYARVQKGFASLYVKNIPRSFEQGRG